MAAAASAAAACAAACGGGGGRGEREAAESSRSRSPLAVKGMNYDTDRELWRPEFVDHEIAAIRNDLHSNAVLLLGSDLDRLLHSAGIAADNGLQVWFEPRQFDADAATTLAFVSDVARAAEELRSDHPEVVLSLGVELTIFMAGLVPGDDWSERGAALGTPAAGDYSARLNAFLADALQAVRPIFGGEITYSSGTWEAIDWTGFDVVGVDLYRDATNAATFDQDVRRLHQHGKPVVITEFGCCSFRGAEDLGGSGFTVVDWSADVPVIPDELVRDEQVQADYIAELLDVFEAERVHGAFVYDFIEPDSPYSSDPHYDFDMAGFAVVRCYGSDAERAYERDGYFEPKAAFDVIASRFR